MVLFFVEFKERWENGVDHCSQLFVANSKEEATQKLEKMVDQKMNINRNSKEYSVKVSSFFEVSEVEGFKIKVES